MINKKYINIVVIIIIIFIINRIQKIKSMSYWRKKNKNILNKLDFFLNEIYNLMDVKYKFLEGGTFLGSVRNKNIIPYDDDVDIGVYLNSQEEFDEFTENLKKKCVSNDIRIKEIWFGLKVIKNEVAIDIFFYTKLKDNIIHYKSKLARSVWPKSYFLDTELKWFEIGYINGKPYNICNNYLRVLERLFGSNWKKNLITHTHSLDIDNFKLNNLLNINNYINAILLFLLKTFKLNEVNLK